MKTKSKSVYGLLESGKYNLNLTMIINSNADEDRGYHGNFDCSKLSFNEVEQLCEDVVTLINARIAGR